ncbi:hypothetical protein ACFFK0_24030 [Paenibacillus chartarius]|uniref:Sporulation protein n=1 Tax=Paenibacillus chartarius TaxID=747481 RepID=A0ABV6DS36_9BACL
MLTNHHDNGHHRCYRQYRLPIITAVLGAALALSGCGNHNADGTPKAQNYPADGYMGLTSVSPNNPVNPGYHHTRDDVRMMRQVINGIPEVTNSTITLNGPIANVDLDLKQGTSETDASRIRDLAFHQLEQQMPRYQIRVTTDRR